MSLSFDPNYKPVGTQMFSPWDNSPFQNPKPNPDGTQMYPSWDDSPFQNPKPNPFGTQMFPSWDNSTFQNSKPNPFGTQKFPAWDNSTYQNPKPSPFPGPKKRFRLDPGINKEEEPKPAPVQTSVSFKGEIGQCMYCLKVDDHYTIACSYAERVPKNAIVSPGCDIVCILCGRYFGGDGGCYSHGGEGRAIFKSCQLCGRVGDHWGADCPDRDQLIKSKSAKVPGTERAESKPAPGGISSFESDPPDVAAAIRKFQDHIRQQCEARRHSQLDKRTPVPTDLVIPGY